MTTARDGKARKATHVHRWEVWGSDARFERCGRCGAVQQNTAPWAIMAAQDQQQQQQRASQKVEE